MLQNLRRTLRSGEPLDLLMLVSGLLHITDERARDPFHHEQPQLDLNTLVDSFISFSVPETTAILTVLRALSADQVMGARIGRELDNRSHSMPGWLSALSHPLAEPDVWFLTHTLGDGDDYLVGVKLSTGQRLSALIYVDHNLGTVVKDAFVVPDSLEDLAIRLGNLIDDPDQSLTRTDPATARAIVERAIDFGSHMYPPLESDTWPMSRPLVEWLLRQLPSGGVAPEPREWSEEELGAIAADFFASGFGAPLDRQDERSLLDSVLWFGSSYNNGDPLRWSPVSVELILLDWFPRKVIADVPYLAKLPNLLRAYIRYCHHRQQIRPLLTRETLDAVDHFEPEYQRIIRTTRPQGPAALLAGLLDSYEDSWDDGNDSSYMMDRLANQVGGRQQLHDLDTQPLPDEPFEWAGIPADIHPAVQLVLDTCDRCADELLDVEHRTAMRRFLGRVAAGDPEIFRRKASPIRAAAAVAWVICRANSSVGGYGAGLPVKELMAWFGVTGSVSQRAAPMLRANGVNPDRLYGSMELGAADLLTSTERARIIQIRDRWLAE